MWTCTVTPSELDGCGNLTCTRPVQQLGPTDLTMYSNGEQIKMHKYLLYLKSPFFRGIFDLDGWEVGCARATIEQ